MANVWTEYVWECSNCGDENKVSWMPELRKALPPCEACGNKEKCEQISADLPPEGAGS